MPDLSCRYLNPGDLACLASLTFAPRRRVGGRHAGVHAAPGVGHSVTFRDYQPYTPGDPLNRVDWNVFGRSDKLLLKRFEDQSPLAAHLLVDASGSMAYPHPAPGARSWAQPLAGVPTATARSKFDQACCCALALAFLVLKQRGQVGLGLAQGGLAHALACQGTDAHLHTCAQHLEATQPTGQAKLASALDALAHRVRRPGLLVLFSDLLEAPADILDALNRWVHQGHEAIVFQILHPDEQQWPDDWQQTLLIDSETGQRLRVNLEEVRDTYQQALARAQDHWRTQLRARRADFNVVLTTQPCTQALARYLVSRASSME